MDYAKVTGSPYEIAPVAEGSPTITVTSNAEYVDAVAALKTTGGTILVDTSGGAFRLDLDRTYAKEQIVVTSADPDNPAEISGMNLVKSQNLTFTGLSFVTGDPLNEFGHAVYLSNTTGISLVGNTVTGTATGRLAVDDMDAGGGGIYMNNAVDTVIADNGLTGLSMGVSVNRSTDTVIQGNVMTRIQLDVMRIVSSDNTTIDRNVVDDLYGSTYDENHDDILQYWHANATDTVDNLTITNNYFNAGDAAYQGIFGGGGMYDTTPATGLVIDNNLVITGSTIHGITATNFTNAQITNNTVLVNDDALFYRTAESTGTSGSQPMINLKQLTNVEVTGNVGLVVESYPERDELTGTVVIENNIQIDYQDPGSPNYVDRMFVNAGTGGEKDLRDFQAIDGSAADGVGSGLTDIDDLGLLSMSVAESATLTQVFDFGVHAPQDGVSYVWTTDDGRIFEGTAVSICFAEDGPRDVTLSALHADGTAETVTRSVTAESPVLFDFDPAAGLPERDPNFRNDVYMTGGDPEIALSADGTRTALSVDPYDQFGVNRLQPAFRALEAFSIQLEFRQDTPEAGGILLHKRGVLRVTANADGSLYVSMNGPENKETMTTEPGVLSDTGWHTVTLSYDGCAGGTGLTVRLDDVAVGVLDVTGLVDMGDYPIVSGAWAPGHPGIDGEIAGLRILNVPTESDAEMADPLAGVPAEMMTGLEMPTDAPAPADVPSLLVASEMAEALVAHLDVDTLGFDALDDLTFAESADGQALAFDGSARTSFALPDMADLQGSDSFTLALSLAIDDAGQAGRVFYAPGFMSMSVNPSGTLTWGATMQDADGAQLRYNGSLGAEASAVLNDGEVHRLVLSYADDGTGLSVWLDGELVKQLEMTGSVGNFGQTMLGDSWKATFGGRVADVAVFDDAADADSIAEDFAAFAGAAMPALPPADVPSLLVASEMAEALVAHLDVDTLGFDALDDLTFAESADGQALAFDGSARTSFALPDMADLQGSDSFTLALSLAIDDAGQAGRVFYAPGFMSMSVNPSGTLTWGATMQDADGAQLRYNGSLGAEASAVLNDGEVHRLVLSYADDGTGLSVWLDGELVKQLEMTGSVGNFGQTMLGDSWKATFGGRVADVAVFDDAADADSIAEDFAAFAGGSGIADPDLATIDLALDDAGGDLSDGLDEAAYVADSVQDTSGAPLPEADAPDPDDLPLEDADVDLVEVDTYQDDGTLI
ncbi:MULTISPECIES: LamG-like jellyroll fold domain-containing protein [Meridianimarinicoccus]|uniref:LamG-like jellyroll fold domain-containing protein n=1 Tax=Meridianimarinicoccus zhengii TaxID=2056810 RepID=UPI000DAE6E50|nr:LamG-like jellyroll fold domain-containing protein [Phycocomes zhengii]